MRMDEQIKKNLNYNNFKKLYEYFLKTSENLCSCCENEIECLGEKCPCYKVLGKECIDENGNKIAFWNRDLTCMDLNFGDCERYDGSICYQCIHSDTGYDGFSWNGKVL